MLKGGVNLNDSENINQITNTYLALKESLMKSSGLSQSEQHNKKKKNKCKNKNI